MANSVIDPVSSLARVETTQHFVVRVCGLSDLKVLRDSRGLVGGDGIDVGEATTAGEEGGVVAAAEVFPCGCFGGVDGVIGGDGCGANVGY